MGRRAPRIPLGPQNYQTYGIARPIDTHFRPATCAEINCPNHTYGWKTLIDEATDLGQRQAYYIRKQSGRGFTEYREGAITVFVFDAGQRCFNSDDHKVALEREPIYLVKGGDSRGNPRGIAPRIHTRGDDWVDDFANHQLKLVDQLNKG